MTRFKHYKSKNARTSPEREPIFKEPLPVVEMLAQLVEKGRCTEKQASEVLRITNSTEFLEFCKKWKVAF